jgi:hypothetical protein
MSKYGATPDFSKPSLCLSCRCAQNVSGHRLNDSFTICRIGGTDAVRMPQPVVKCSEYDDQAAAPLWQLEKIAWRFSVDDKKKTAGFLKPNEWRSKVKSEGGDPDDA